jgi:hypothetical protein
MCQHFHQQTLWGPSKKGMCFANSVNTFHRHIPVRLTKLTATSLYNWCQYYRSFRDNSEQYLKKLSLAIWIRQGIMYFGKKWH